MISKIKIGTVELFKANWDMLTGAAYGTLLVVQKQSTIEIIWHTVLVTAVAFLAKKFFTWAYDQIIKAWK